MPPHLHKTEPVLSSRFLRLHSRGRSAKHTRMQGKIGHSCRHPGKMRRPCPRAIHPVPSWIWLAWACSVEEEVQKVVLAKYVTQYEGGVTFRSTFSILSEIKTCFGTQKPQAPLLHSNMRYAIVRTANFRLGSLPALTGVSRSLQQREDLPTLKAPSGGLLAHHRLDFQRATTKTIVIFCSSLPPPVYRVLRNPHRLCRALFPTLFFVVGVRRRIWKVPQSM